MEKQINLDDYKILLSTLETEEGIEYLAEFREYEFCCGSGLTVDEAVKEAKENLNNYIQELVMLGKPIVEPMKELTYSGKFTVRLSKSMHKKAAEMAEEEGVSLNTFINEAISEKVGIMEMYSFVEKYESALNRIAISMIGTRAAMEVLNSFNSSTSEYIDSLTINPSYLSMQRGLKLCKV